MSVRALGRAGSGIGADGHRPHPQDTARRAGAPSSTGHHRTESLAAGSGSVAHGAARVPPQRASSVYARSTTPVAAREPIYVPPTFTADLSRLAQHRGMGPGAVPQAHNAAAAAAAAAAARVAAYTARQAAASAAHSAGGTPIADRLAALARQAAAARQQDATALRARRRRTPGATQSPELGGAGGAVDSAPLPREARRDDARSADSRSDCDSVGVADHGAERSAPRAHGMPSYGGRTDDTASVAMHAAPLPGGAAPAAHAGWAHAVGVWRQRAASPTTAPLAVPAAVPLVGVLPIPPPRPAPNSRLALATAAGNRAAAAARCGPQPRWGAPSPTPPAAGVAPQAAAAAAPSDGMACPAACDASGERAGATARDGTGSPIFSPSPRIPSHVLRATWSECGIDLASAPRASTQQQQQPQQHQQHQQQQQQHTSHPHVALSASPSPHPVVPDAPRSPPLVSCERLPSHVASGSRWGHVLRSGSRAASTRASSRAAAAVAAAQQGARTRGGSMTQPVTRAGVGAAGVPGVGVPAGTHEGSASAVLASGALFNPSVTCAATAAAATTATHAHWLGQARAAAVCTPPPAAHAPFHDGGSTARARSSPPLRTPTRSPSAPSTYGAASAARTADASSEAARAHGAPVATTASPSRPAATPRPLPAHSAAATAAPWPHGTLPGGSTYVTAAPHTPRAGSAGPRTAGSASPRTGGSGTPRTLISLVASPQPLGEGVSTSPPIVPAGDSAARIARLSAAAAAARLRAEQLAEQAEDADVDTRVDVAAALGLPADAVAAPGRVSEAAVRAAYLSMALVAHPDKACTRGGDAAGADGGVCSAGETPSFAEVNAAYTVMKDPSKHALYLEARAALRDADAAEAALAAAN